MAGKKKTSGKDKPQLTPAVLESLVRHYEKLAVEYRRLGMHEESELFLNASIDFAATMESIDNPVQPSSSSTDWPTITIPSNKTLRRKDKAG